MAKQNIESKIYIPGMIVLLSLLKAGTLETTIEDAPFFSKWRVRQVIEPPYRILKLVYSIAKCFSKSC